MKVELREDGFKVLVEPDELNLIQRFFPIFAVFMEIYTAMALKFLVVGSAAPEEKLKEAVAGVGDQPTAALMGDAADKLLGEEVIRSFMERLDAIPPEAWRTLRPE